MLSSTRSSLPTFSYKIKTRITSYALPRITTLFSTAECVTTLTQLLQFILKNKVPQKKKKNPKCAMSKSPHPLII